MLCVPLIFLLFRTAISMIVSHMHPLHSCTSAPSKVVPSQSWAGTCLWRKRSLKSISLAWNVVKITKSSTSSTCNTSLLKRSTYYLNDSPSTCQIFNRWPKGFLWCCPPMKWRTNFSFSCSKLAIVLSDSLLNHIMAMPFRVVENALHMTSF